MNILFVSSGLKSSYGGPPLSESLLIAELSKTLKVQVFCLASRWDPKFTRTLKIENITPYTCFDFFKLWPKVDSIFHAIHRAEVIHLNGFWDLSHFFWFLFCTVMKKPYVIQPRGMAFIGHRGILKKKIYSLFLGRRVLKSAFRIISLSRFENKLIQTVAELADNTVIIPNIISVKIEKKKETGQQNRQPYFLYLGRLESRKNIELLLEAFCLYRKKSNLMTLILCGPVERNYAAGLKTLVENLELSAHVRFISALYGHEKAELIRNATALFYMTKNEAFGRVPFESAIEGTVCVVPKNSGASEYYGSEALELISNENPLEISEKMFFIESLKVDLYEKLIKHLQSVVVSQFAASVVADKYLLVYKRSLATVRTGLQCPSK